jgi:hypothetical protein
MKAALKGQPKLEFAAPTFIGGVDAFPIPDPVATIAPSDAATWCTTADLEGAMKDLTEFCTKALKKYLITTPKDEP